MRTQSSSRLGKSPGRPRKPASGPATNQVRFLTPMTAPARAGGETQQSRVLVMVEEGFDGQPVDEILRREHREVTMDSTNDTVIQRVKSEQVDVLLLCSTHSGRRVMDLLNRITQANPALPVIVVTSPTPAAAESLPQYLAESVAPLPVDAGLLLRSVREALTEPKVKRLIRLTGSHGEPSFVARNARWLSEDLQARYSMPFHWTQPDVPIPLRIENVASAHL